MIQIAQILFGIVYSVLEAILTTLGDFVVSAVPPRRKGLYDADFTEPEKILQKHSRDNGFCIGTWFNSIAQSNSHMICIGGSGSNKSTTVCYNTILQSHNFSYIIHDCSKELFNGTAEALRQAGYNILVLDYSEEKSECFNALAKCRSYEDVSKMASILIRNSLDGQPDYWSQSAEMLVAFFCKAVWKYAEPEYRNLPNVLHMINTFSFAPGKVDTWIIQTHDAHVIDEYKAICATPDKTLQSSLSTAKTALSIYSNPNIQKLTSIDTIDFAQFRLKKTALFICNSPASAHFYRSISATLIQSFFDHLLEKLPSKADIPIMFLLDEVAVMKLSTLSAFLSLSRKYAISVCTLWQDYNQIEQIYNKHEAANIFANSKLKVFMPCAKSLETCSMLEKLLGKFHLVDEDNLTRTRELLTAQEIFQLKKILVLNGNDQPLLLPVQPFYEQPKLKRLSELPVYEVQSKLPFDIPPFIQFDTK